jgi:polysaccharide biosynthesis protein PslH
VYNDISYRRIAQRQSASKHTEEVAAFDSCSAYQNISRPEILFLSHCVPNPPDKGEKIRAHHELNCLTEKYAVHLACFARAPHELEQARALTDRCASVHAELLPFVPTLSQAAARFAAGRSLTASFFGSPRLRAFAHGLAGRVRAVVAYSTVMGQHAPAGVPLIYDMVDVDSEKWLTYGQTRFPGFVYAAEGRRLRELERTFAARAACTFLATEPERDLLRSFAPAGAVASVENGVDAAFFDPSQAFARPFPAPAVVFCGAMDYYPNSEAVRWFARDVFPLLRSRRPELEFWIVGRNPSRDVERLAAADGIRVSGAVPDVRPWLAAAEHVVAPLQLARGIQNKVLEALAMGKVVLASDSVCRTFGANVPLGVVLCEAAGDYVQAPAVDRAAIRAEAQSRFDWKRNLSRLEAAVEQAVTAGRRGP